MSLQLEEFLSTALEGYLSGDILLKNRSRDTLRKYFRQHVGDEQGGDRKQSGWVYNEPLIDFVTNHASEEVRLLLGEEIEFASTSLSPGIALPSDPAGSVDLSPYQKGLVSLLNDDSIAVASCVGKAVAQLVATVKENSSKEIGSGGSGHETWVAFKGLWAHPLTEAFLKDTNSPHPYRSMLRLGDAILTLSPASQQAATLGLYDVIKPAFDSFFNAATLSVTADVLQFVNLLRLIEICVCNGLQMPQELQELILQQLRRPTSDDPFSALAKPQLLHFVGGCARADSGALLPRCRETGNTTQKWCESVIQQAISLAAGEETAIQELREFLVPLLETLGAIGSSPNGHFFLRSVAEESGCALLFRDMLRNCVQSKRTELIEAALFCLQMLLEGHPNNNGTNRKALISSSEADVVDMEKFIGEFVMSKELFREVIWPLNKHFEPTVRQKLWKMLGPLLFWQKSDGGVSGNGVGKIALNVVGTWISGPENLEAEVEVRTEQLNFMKVILNDILTPDVYLKPDDPQAQVLGLLRSKVEAEYTKGLYPNRQVLKTDAGVDR